jgi:sugar-phosphatase
VEIVCQSILFDSDGVLVDSHSEGRRAWSQLGREFDFTMDDERFATLAGIRTADSLARLVAPARLDDAIARLEDIEVGLAATTRPLPGACELVSTIPSERWAIVTSASRRLGSARWAAAGIPQPRVVVCAEDVIEGKPHPEPYLYAASQLGTEITECLVVEDSPGGGRAGLIAGARVLAVGAHDWSLHPTWRVSSLSGVRCAVTDQGVLSISTTVD